MLPASFISENLRDRRSCTNDFATDKGWIKGKRVHRVEGWADNLKARVIGVIGEARERNAKAADYKAKDTLPATPESSAALLSVINKLDEAHGNGIKYPKLRFKVDGQKVVIARAGSASKHEGCANVTDGKPFGDNLWYGRIEQDGSFRKGKAFTPKIDEFLTELSDDVVGYTATHGQKTGNCAFCGRHLTTKESVTAGYGPVCAGKWGLPWGHIDATLFGKKEVTELTTELD